MEQPPLASYWLVAADTGYASPADWQCWADRITLASDEPPHWVLELGRARTAADVRSATAETAAGEPTTDKDRDLASIGYLWLRHERGDLDLYHFLTSATKHTGWWDDSLLFRIDLLRGILDLECSGFTMREPISSHEQYAREATAQARAEAVRQWSVIQQCESL